MSRTLHPLIRGTAVCVALASLLAGTGIAATQARSSERSELQSALDGLVSAGAPGAILLVRNGDRTLRLASGYGDVVRKTPMRVDDRFRIASLTKSYVSTVVLQLAAEGKLSLDDSIERRLPGVVPNGDKITIRRLLNHTTGLFDYENDPSVLKPYLNGNLGYAWAPRRLVQIALSHKPLFKPGDRYSYSNTNYMIAGLIIEAVTGHRLGSELRHRLFQPLHLRSTSFPLTPRVSTPFAHGYYLLGQPPATDVSGLDPFPWAAGAIVSTADDVVSFYRALLSGHLLPPALLREMKTTVAEGRGQSDIPGQRSGLGLERFPTPCGDAYGHNGTFPGYLVYAFTSKSGRRQTLLMVNESAESLPKRFAPCTSASSPAPTAKGRRDHLHTHNRL
ncbi:MAG: beta-lactamase family protein [Actinobacteria bacterium]|nr:MAG: beta-lactamase family protein [Actinomycetota bacterium]